MKNVKDYNKSLNEGKTMIDRDKHIWEGWTVGAFIDGLEITFRFQRFTTKDEVKKWCKSEQPYYKKHIPEVYKYFVAKAGL